MERGLLDEDTEPWEKMVHSCTKGLSVQEALGWLVGHEVEKAQDKIKKALGHHGQEPRLSKKEKIAQEPRWEIGGGHVSSLWKATAYTERALRSVQKFAQCMLYMWVTHSLVYEPGDRPSSKTNGSTGIPHKGHSQGVERLEFQFW